MPKIVENKKKEYVLELEEKIKELESKIASLQGTIQSYKDRIFSLAVDQERDFRNYFETKRYFEQDFTKFINGSNQSECIEKFKQVAALLGTNGEDRRNFINKCIRSIIEEIVSDPMAKFMALDDNKPNATTEEYTRLLKATKYQAAEMLRDPKFNKTDRLYYTLGTPPNSREAMLDKRQLVYDHKAMFTEAIHDLIKVRNRIFDLQESVSSSKESLLTPDFDFNELCKMNNYMRQLNANPEFSIFKLWSIKPKKHEDPINDEVTLTDTDS